MDYGDEFEGEGVLGEVGGVEGLDEVDEAYHGEGNGSASCQRVGIRF